MIPGCDPSLRNSAAHVFVSDLALPVLSEADSHHLARVLRIKTGAVVTISDGRGSWAKARWERDGVVAETNVISESESRTGVHVAFAPTKGDRPEWAVQKLTEIGVSSIRPLICGRSVVRWDRTREQRVLERWERIVREAAMQSRRVWLPEVLPAVDVQQLSVDGLVMRCDVGGQSVATTLNTCHDLADDAVHLLIGPEGGFTQDEALAWPTAIGFGTTVLRSETAAVALAAVLIDHLSERSCTETL